MEKTCANHPESLALATCKACEKSICLMCVQDEKEGTFCSTKCVQVFREVSDWVDPGSAVAAAAAPAPAAQPTGSIFDPEPQSATPPAPVAADLPPAPAEPPAEFEPLVTPGTKWRMIGSVCASHTDTPAVATCEACDKTVCSLCVVEAENGTFCTACAAAKSAPAPRPLTISAPKPAPAAPPPARRSARRRSSPVGKIVAVFVILGVLGGAGYYFFIFENGAPTNPGIPGGSPNPGIARNPDPIKTDPVKTDPVKTDPVKTDPVKTDPVKTDPDKTDPVVEPRVIRKAEPPPRIKLPGIVLNPWASQNPGAWFRLKREKAGQESYTDIILKDKDADSYALTTGEGEVRVKLAPYWVKGETSLVIEDQKWLCEIREYESPPARQWVLLQGRNAGAVLKEESEQVKMMATRLWEHEAKVGRRTVDCIVVEGTRNGQPFKQWYSAGLPVPVKSEAGGITTTLVGLGDDAANRPPLPK